MSKSVAITEGDRAYRFGKCSYLRTNKQGGGYVVWVPEDDRDTTTKHITKDGTYKIEDEKKSDGGKYFGFSEVSVNVPDSNKAIGKKPDGNTHVVQPDPENDDLLNDKIIPDYIKITNNPSKISYTDGESISKDGMVVKAYQGDGSLWEATGYSGGIIPNSELNLDPNVAHYGGEGGEGSIVYPDYQESGTVDITGLADVYTFATALFMEQVAPYIAAVGDNTEIDWRSQLLSLLSQNGDNWKASVCSVHSVTIPSSSSWAAGGYFQIYVYNYTTGDTANLSTYNYRTYRIYYGAGSNMGFKVTSVNFTGGGDASLFVGKHQVANTWVYSNINAYAAGGAGSITVKWDRPDDGKTLTDTFDITVSPLR